MKIILAIILATGLYANFIATAGISMGGFGTKSTGNSIAESPFGTFGVEYRTESAELYYEHTSSIPQINESLGINIVGARYRLHLFDLEPYLGVAMRNKNYDGEYYKDRLSDRFYIFGLEKMYDDKSLYIEHKESINKGNDLTTFGFKLYFDSEDK